mgnify:CR=1 FL=1
MQTNTNGRPKGSRNAKPTKRAIAGYYGLLRSAADQGDIVAAAELIKIHTAEQHQLTKEVIHAK